MNSSKWITPCLKQIWCASGSLIAVMGQGMTMGYLSCLLSALEAPDSPIKTNIQSASWLAAVSGPSMFVGVMLSCIYMDCFGRRRANILSILPGVLGWIITYLAQSYAVLLIGRVLLTFTMGGVFTVGQIALGEYTSPQNRGMLLNLKTGTSAIGITIAHILGNYMHWRTIAIMSLIPNIIALLITYTWPESPTWLATRMQYDKCEQNFFWLRGVNEKTVNEVSELIKAQKERLLQKKKKVSVRGKVSELFKKIKRKDFLKPLVTLIIANFLMEATGRHYFSYYALQIMNEALSTKITPYYNTLCIDLIVVVSTMFSTILIKVMKRRTLLFSSGIASLIILICMCSYLFLISINIVHKGHTWEITLFFIVYFFLINLGCSPIPIMLPGELFPVAHRELGSAFLGVFASLNLMGYLKVTPYFLKGVKVHGTFAIYGGAIAISLLILYFILPETKNKTLQEIENFYHHGKFSDIEQKDEVEIKLISDKE